MKEILIVCAMEEEAEPFLKLIGKEADEFLLPKNYNGKAKMYSNIINVNNNRNVNNSKNNDTNKIPLAIVKNNIVLNVLITGIGLTNMASALTMALLTINPDLVMFAGTSGGIGKNVKIGDIIIGNEALYHDADSTTFGYSAGQIPQMPKSYTANNELITIAEESLNKNIPFHTGLISSSNSFINSENLDYFLQIFPNLLAIDMETTAGAQVCHSFDVPWISLRAVSDLCSVDAGKVSENSTMDTSLKSFEAIMLFINSL